MHSTPPTIYVVDDEPSFVTAVTRLLRAGGYAFEAFRSATEFLKTPPTDEPGCIIVDLNMPGPSGLDLQEVLAKTGNSLPIIFLTGQGDIPTSVQAIRKAGLNLMDLEKSKPLPPVPPMIFSRPHVKGTVGRELLWATRTTSPSSVLR